MTAIKKIEQRLSLLEADVIKLKEKRAQSGTSLTGHVWLEKVFGAFANDQDYLVAMELGREQRESSDDGEPRKPKRRRSHVDS